MPGYSESGTPDDWDTAAGTVRGYRWWRVSIPLAWMGYPPPWDSVDLQGEWRKIVVGLTGARGHSWGSGLNTASCPEPLHRPPEHGHNIPCGCGFWGYWRPGVTAASIVGYPFTGCSYTKLTVTGCIEASGRVIIGERGFRSQHARITALAIGHESRDFVSRDMRKLPTHPLWDAYDPDAAQVGAEEASVRLGRIEDVLSRSYPGARVLKSEESLFGEFPPDENYGTPCPRNVVG